MSCPAPDQTAQGPLTVSHDASTLQESAHTPSCCACTMGVYPHAEAPQAQGILPQLTPSRRGTSPPSQVKESTPCVCISMSLSNPNHTIQVCLRNTPVFQTILTRNHTKVITGSSELIGRRPAYQSGRPGLY